MMAMKRKLNEIFIAKTNASFDDTENIWAEIFVIISYAGMKAMLPS